MEGIKKLRIVVFPWLAFGHMIPFLELSKCLASKGHSIYFVSTPRNLGRLPKIPPHLAHLITLVPLPLPLDENLPADAEATSDVPFDKVEFLKKSYDGLQEPMARFLEASSPVDWIIYDFSNYWLPAIADKLCIKKVFFSILNAWSITSFLPLTEGGGVSRPKPENLTKPLKRISFDNEAKLTTGSPQKDASGVSDYFRATSSIRGCDVIAVRSCLEIEAEYLQLLEDFHGKPVVPVGLLPTLEDYRIKALDETWKSINEWLNKQKNNSVVYIALGSEVAPSEEQFSELALGLELSQVPFFWAFRKPNGITAELPKGFEERTKDRGLVWRDWVPQPRILAHDTVAAFLTHCGWGSVNEGLQFGKPLIMLPFVLDQGLNASVLAEKKVGIEIPRNNEDGSFNRSSVAETLRLLLQDENGMVYKEAAKKISGIFGDQSLHSQYVDKFEEYLCNHRTGH